MQKTDNLTQEIISECVTPGGMIDYECQKELSPDTADLYITDSVDTSNDFMTLFFSFLVAFLVLLAFLAWLIPFAFPKKDDEVSD